MSDRFLVSTSEGLAVFFVFLFFTKVQVKNGGRDDIQMYLLSYSHVYTPIITTFQDESKVQDINRYKACKSAGIRVQKSTCRLCQTITGVLKVTGKVGIKQFLACGQSLNVRFVYITWRRTFTK